ncbi:hypothetical protein [Ekhidna sp.]|uniref:hypothetical protein n=1 Tax=Ekhidna sp. TaxID=2608089 RepID=UPI003B50D741
MSSQKITIHNVWVEKTDELIQEIISFWNQYNAIPPSEDIVKRAKQVVIVARNANNQIIGVTTSYLTDYPTLKNNLFVFRGMISPVYRVPGLFIKITKETIQVLETYSKSIGEEDRPIGLIAEMENPHLKSVGSTKTPSGMTLIGFSKKDNPIYVYYFKGARFN